MYIVTGEKLPTYSSIDIKSACNHLTMLVKQHVDGPFSPNTMQFISRLNLCEQDTLNPIHWLMFSEHITNEYIALWWSIRNSSQVDHSFYEKWALPIFELFKTAPHLECYHILNHLLQNDKHHNDIMAIVERDIDVYFNSRGLYPLIHACRRIYYDRFKEIESGTWSHRQLFNSILQGKGLIPFIDYRSSLMNPIPQFKAVEGYKAFNTFYNRLQCRDYIFDPTKDHHSNFVYPCFSGFHFCKHIEDIDKYYSLHDPNVEVYKVLGWGVVMNHQNKTVSSDLRILTKVDREIYLNQISDANWN